jgi:hypothetical protein
MKRQALLFALAVPFLMPQANAQKPFTLEQVMSAPFPSELNPAPSKGRVAWVFNALGCGAGGGRKLQGEASYFLFE